VKKSLKNKETRKTPLFFQRTRGEETRGRKTVVMPPKETKRAKGSVGEGEAGKQAKATQHAGGQGTASLTTITAVVKQTEGDKYVTSSLVLPFIHTCMKSLAEHGSIKQPWFGPANPRREFPVSSAHESINAARLSIRQDLEDRWVTNLNGTGNFFFSYCITT
jgi:hypothetical protein